MNAQIFAKGTDGKTGLPVTVQRTGYFHNEEAACIEVYYKRILNYPNGNVEVLSRERLIVQNVDAVGDAPAITKYTDYCTQFNADAIGTAIDNFLSTM